MVGAAILIGWLTEAVVGAAVFALALALGAIAYLRAAKRDRGTPLRNAAHATHPHGASAGKRHVLVIANEALSGTALRERILGDGHEQVEVDVLAPVLTSRAHYGVSDIDRELEEARVRLGARSRGLASRASSPAGRSAIRVPAARSRMSCATSGPTRSSSSRIRPSRRPGRSAISSSVCAASSTCRLHASRSLAMARSRWSSATSRAGGQEESDRCSPSWPD